MLAAQGGSITSASSDVQVTIGLPSGTELFAPYDIRGGVIAPYGTGFGQDTMSYFKIFPCDENGTDLSASTNPQNSMPLLDLQIQSNSLTAYAAFGTGGNQGGLAGFGISLVIWTTKTFSQSDDSIQMSLNLGVAGNAYIGRFKFVTDSTAWNKLPTMGSSNNITWTQTALTITGLPPAIGSGGKEKQGPVNF